MLHLLCFAVAFFLRSGHAEQLAVLFMGSVCPHQKATTEESRKSSHAIFGIIPRSTKIGVETIGLHSSAIKVKPVERTVFMITSTK